MNHEERAREARLVSESRTTTRRACTYAGLVATLFLTSLLLRDFTWQGTTDLHTLMEAVATLLALFVGLVAFVHFYAKKNNMFLFIGAGFIGTALLDGYHAVATSHWFDGFWLSDLSRLMPWSWNTSRLFLAVLMLFSWLMWRREQRLGAGGRISERHVYGIVSCMTLWSFVFLAYAALPRSHYPELPFARPEEFLSALIFLIAFAGYLTKGSWKTDAFEHWVMLSLILGVVGQASFMAFSFQSFDPMFNTAHLVKNASYACVLVGLLISMYRLFRRAEESAQELSAMNEALRDEVTHRRQAQQELEALTHTLEQRVIERTQELKAQQLAALNIAGEAEEARARAERSEQAQARFAEELASSNKELEQFAYVASHDLQEPLRMVASYLQLLARRYRGKLDADADDFIGFAVDGATRMQALIGDLLTYSRVGSRGKPFVSKDSSAIADRALSNLEIAIKESGALVTRDPLPTIPADEVQLAQLFQNLVGNAIKFHRDEAPTVHLSAQRNGTQWVFSVRDNGIGIAPEHVDRIFGIFQRLHTTREFPGTGIGLAVCKKIVERHGGRIWVDSTPGEHSTFYFTIPDPGGVTP